MSHFLSIYGGELIQKLDEKENAKFLRKISKNKFSKEIEVDSSLLEKLSTSEKDLIKLRFLALNSLTNFNTFIKN